METIEEKLPEFWALARKVASDLRAERYASRDALIRSLSPLLVPELIERMDQTVPGWKKIATLNDGQTALHTLVVLALCLNLPEYNLADEQTCTELEWAALLHDLDKERARRDSAHPFRSAAKVAQIMPALGFDLTTDVVEADIVKWSELVLSAQRSDGDRMLHDHSRLPEIVSGLYTCWGRNNSAERILKAVLFHQSLPTLSDWPNAVLLNDEELSYALNLHDMKVLGPLLVADSDSWNIFSENRTAYLYELRASNAETRQRIQKLAPTN